MRIPVFFGFSVLTMALVGLPANGAVQQTAEKKPVLTIKTPARQVELLVTVRDKKGAPVSGLKATDLTLTEDGRSQTVQSFEPSVQATNFPYRLGLLVDTGRGLFGAMESERKAAGKFVDQMLPEKPNAMADQAFLIHFDHEVELLKDFTASREKLHRELDEMGPSRPAQEDAQGPVSSGGDERSHGGRGGTQLYDAIFLASDELMKTQEGHKVLIVFSDGADRDSKESLSDAVDAAEKANVAVYAIYMKPEQERGGGKFPGLGGGHQGGGYPGGGGGGYPGGGRSGGGEKAPAIDGKKILEKMATASFGLAAHMMWVVSGFGVPVGS